MTEVYRYVLFALTGLLILMSFCRLTMLWQKSHTPRDIWFTIFFITFSVVAASRSYTSSLAVIVTTYVVLVIVLAICNWYEWSESISFLREKNVLFLKKETTTLVDVAEDNALVLNAQSLPEKEKQ